MKPSKKLIRKSCVSIISILFAFQNVGLLHAAESNFWEERRQVRASQQQEIRKAHELSQKLKNPDTLMASLPKVDAGLALPFSGKALSELGISNDLQADQKSQLAKKWVPDWMQVAIAPHATIQDVALSDNPNAKTVLLLQDAHLHFEAQENIAGVIDEVARGLNKNRDSHLLVGLEAADIKNADYSAYAEMDHQDVLRKVSKTLLKANILSGPEYAVIGFLGKERSVNKTVPIRMTGVESEAQYQENVKALRDSVPYKQLAKEALKSLKQELVALKKKHYTKNHFVFDSKLAGFEKGTIGVPEYVLYLDSVSPAIKPNSRQLISAALLEGAIDFKKVERERASMLNILVEKMTESEIKNLLQYSTLYRSGKLSYAAYYGHLKKVAKRHGVDFKSYPEMSLYIQYVLKSEGIDPAGLFEEIQQHEKRVQNKLFNDAGQKEIAYLTQDYHLLEKLSQHILTEDEWHEYKTRQAKIKDLEARFQKLGHALPEPVRKMKDYWTILQEFYESAIARNNTMAERMVARLEADSTDTGVLVAGGFHTQGLVRELKKRDVSVLTLSPKITRLEGGLSSLDFLANNQTPLDQMFRGERLFLSLARASIQTPVRTQNLNQSMVGAITNDGSVSEAGSFSAQRVPANGQTENMDESVSGEKSQEFDVDGTQVRVAEQEEAQSSNRDGLRRAVQWAVAASIVFVFMGLTMAPASADFIVLTSEAVPGTASLVENVAELPVAMMADQGESAFTWQWMVILIVVLVPSALLIHRIYNERYPEEISVTPGEPNEGEDIGAGLVISPKSEDEQARDNQAQAFLAAARGSLGVSGIADQSRIINLAEIHFSEIPLQSYPTEEVEFIVDELNEMTPSWQEFEREDFIPRVIKGPTSLRELMQSSERLSSDERSFGVDPQLPEFHRNILSNNSGLAVAIGFFSVMVVVGVLAALWYFGLLDLLSSVDSRTIQRVLAAVGIGMAVFATSYGFQGPNKISTGQMRKLQADDFIKDLTEQKQRGVNLTIDVITNAVSLHFVNIPLENYPFNEQQEIVNRIAAIGLEVGSLTFDSLPLVFPGPDTANSFIPYQSEDDFRRLYSVDLNDFSRAYGVPRIDLDALREFYDTALINRVNLNNFTPQTVQQLITIMDRNEQRVQNRRRLIIGLAIGLTVVLGVLAIMWGLGFFDVEAAKGAAQGTMQTAGFLSFLAIPTNPARRTMKDLAHPDDVVVSRKTRNQLEQAIRDSYFSESTINQLAALYGPNAEGEDNWDRTSENLNVIEPMKNFIRDARNTLRAALDLRNDDAIQLNLNVQAAMQALVEQAQPHLNAFDNLPAKRQRQLRGLRDSLQGLQSSARNLSRAMTNENKLIQRRADEKAAREKRAGDQHEQEKQKRQERIAQERSQAEQARENARAQREQARQRQQDREARAQNRAQARAARDRAREVRSAILPELTAMRRELRGVARNVERFINAQRDRRRGVRPDARSNRDFVLLESQIEVLESAISEINNAVRNRTPLTQDELLLIADSLNSVVENLEYLVDQSDLRGAIGNQANVFVWTVQRARQVQRTVNGLLGIQEGRQPASTSEENQPLERIDPVSRANQENFGEGVEQQLTDAQVQVLEQRIGEATPLNENISELINLLEQVAQDNARFGGLRQELALVLRAAASALDSGLRNVETDTEYSLNYLLGELQHLIDRIQRIQNHQGYKNKKKTYQKTNLPENLEKILVTARNIRNDVQQLQTDFHFSAAVFPTEDSRSEEATPQPAEESSQAAEAESEVAEQVESPAVASTDGTQQTTGPPSEEAQDLVLGPEQVTVVDAVLDAARAEGYISPSNSFDYPAEFPGPYQPDFGFEKTNGFDYILRWVNMAISNVGLTPEDLESGPTVLLVGARDQFQAALEHRQNGENELALTELRNGLILLREAVKTDGDSEWLVRLESARSQIRQALRVTNGVIDALETELSQQTTGPPGEEAQAEEPAAAAASNNGQATPSNQQASASRNGQATRPTNNQAAAQQSQPAAQQQEPTSQQQEPAAEQQEQPAASEATQQPQQSETATPQSPTSIGSDADVPLFGRAYNQIRRIQRFLLDGRLTSPSILQTSNRAGAIGIFLAIAAFYPENTRLAERLLRDATYTGNNRQEEIWFNNFKEKALELMASRQSLPRILNNTSFFTSASTDWNQGELVAFLLLMNRARPRANWTNLRQNLNEEALELVEEAFGLSVAVAQWQGGRYVYDAEKLDVLGVMEVSRSMKALHNFRTGTRTSDFRGLVSRIMVVLGPEFRNVANRIAQRLARQGQGASVDYPGFGEAYAKLNRIQDKQNLPNINARNREQVISWFMAIAALYAENPQLALRLMDKVQYTGTNDRESRWFEGYKQQAIAVLKSRQGRRTALQNNDLFPPTFDRSTDRRDLIVMFLLKKRLQQTNQQVAPENQEALDEAFGVKLTLPTSGTDGQGIEIDVIGLLELSDAMRRFGRANTSLDFDATSLSGVEQNYTTRNAAIDQAEELDRRIAASLDRRLNLTGKGADRMHPHLDRFRAQIEAEVIAPIVAQEQNEQVREALEQILRRMLFVEGAIAEYVLFNFPDSAWAQEIQAARADISADVAAVAVRPNENQTGVELDGPSQTRTVQVSEQPELQTNVRSEIARAPQTEERISPENLAALEADMERAAQEARAAEARETQTQTQTAEPQQRIPTSQLALPRFQPGIGVNDVSPLPTPARFALPVDDSNETDDANNWNGMTRTPFLSPAQFSFFRILLVLTIAVVGWADLGFAMDESVKMAFQFFSLAVPAAVLKEELEHFRTARNRDLVPEFTRLGLNVDVDDSFKTTPEWYKSLRAGQLGFLFTGLSFIGPLFAVTSDIVAPRIGLEVAFNSYIFTATFLALLAITTFWNKETKEWYTNLGGFIDRQPEQNQPAPVKSFKLKLAQIAVWGASALMAYSFVASHSLPFFQQGAGIALTIVSLVAVVGITRAIANFDGTFEDVQSYTEEAQVVLQNAPVIIDLASRLRGQLVDLQSSGRFANDNFIKTLSEYMAHLISAKSSPERIEKFLEFFEDMDKLNAQISTRDFLIENEEQLAEIDDVIRSFRTFANGNRQFVRNIKAMQARAEADQESEESEEAEEDEIVEFPEEEPEDRAVVRFTSHEAPSVFRRFRQYYALLSDAVQAGSLANIDFSQIEGDGRKTGFLLAAATIMAEGPERVALVQQFLQENLKATDYKRRILENVDLENDGKPISIRRAVQLAENETKANAEATERDLAAARRTAIALWLLRNRDSAVIDAYANADPSKAHPDLVFVLDNVLLNQSETIEDIPYSSQANTADGQVVVVRSRSYQTFRDFLADAIALREGRLPPSSFNVPETPDQTLEAPLPDAPGEPNTIPDPTKDESEEQALVDTEVVTDEEADQLFAESEQASDEAAEQANQEQSQQKPSTGIGSALRRGVASVLIAAATLFGMNKDTQGSPIQTPAPVTQTIDGEAQPDPVRGQTGVSDADPTQLSETAFRQLLEQFFGPLYPSLDQRFQNPRTLRFGALSLSPISNQPILDQAWAAYDAADAQTKASAVRALRSPAQFTDADTVRATTFDGTINYDSAVVARENVMPVFDVADGNMQLLWLALTKAAESDQPVRMAVLANESDFNAQASPAVKAAIANAGNNVDLIFVTDQSYDENALDITGALTNILSQTQNSQYQVGQFLIHSTRSNISFDVSRVLLGLDYNGSLSINILFLPIEMIAPLGERMRLGMEAAYHA